MKVRLVVNPNAGGGRARTHLHKPVSEFERLGLRCEVAETQRPGHATELARDAFSADVDLIAVMGGDGTLSEVAQAWADPQGRPVSGPALGLLPFGTGGDFRRNFDLSGDLIAAVRRIVEGRPRPIDLARATFVAHDGTALTRCFINVGSFGISGAVSHLVNSGPKWLAGNATFYLASLRATLGYRNVSVRLSVDGEPFHEGPTYLGAFANGRYFGGGMQIAPGAQLDDGLLDCVVLGDYSRAAAIANTPKVYEGKHLELGKTKLRRGRHFEVAPWLDDSIARIELDGETPGRLPMSIETLPGAITLRC